MASIIKVDDVQDAAGNNIINEAGDVITIGASGDTINIASGATNNIGISNAQQWRTTAAQTAMDDGDVVTDNWEQADSYGAGVIGAAMSESSGVFTFPSTGIWHISFTCVGSDDVGQLYIGGLIQSTTDDGSYNTAALGNSNLDSSAGNKYFTTTVDFIFDVTSTSTHKIRFTVTCSTNGIALTGNTNRTDTGAVFTRLGDT